MAFLALRQAQGTSDKIRAQPSSTSSRRIRPIDKSACAGCRTARMTAVAGRVKVFLSYRRADTQHVAGRVGDELGEQFELFMDIDTIPPGVDFTDYVRRAVGSCDVLLAFIGDRWVSLTDDERAAADRRPDGLGRRGDQGRPEARRPGHPGAGRERR